MKMAIKANIYGRVQGVGFRYFAAHEAKLLGITGYVRNLMDGSVEVFAEGEESIINRYMIILKDGPRFGRVQDIQVENHPSQELYNDFIVKY